MVINWIRSNWWWVAIAGALILGSVVAWQVCLLAGAFDLPALP